MVVLSKKNCCACAFEEVNTWEVVLLFDFIETSSISSLSSVDDGGVGIVSSLCI